MNVLIVCHTHGNGNWQTIQNTWANELPVNYHFVFAGDEPVYKQSTADTWITNSGPNNSYKLLPLKTLNMFRLSLTYEWDYIYKCDDDTLLLPGNLKQYIDNLTSNIVYGGVPLPCFWKSCDTYHYAQGGHYIISRKVLIDNWSYIESCLSDIKFTGDTRKPPEPAEDVGLGYALKHIGITHNLNKLLLDVAHNEWHVDPRRLDSNKLITNQSDLEVSWVKNKVDARDDCISIHHLQPRSIQLLYKYIYNSSQP